MSEQIANTPHATAAMLDITPVTLRRWCEYHAGHLSTVANPLSGKARRFTGRDVEVLKHVRSLRAQGLTTADINEQLAGLTFAVIDTDEHRADSGAIVPQNPPDGLQQAPASIVTADTIISIQRQIEGLQQARQEDLRGRRDAVQWFAFGFLVAAFMFLGMVVLSWLYSGG